MGEEDSLIRKGLRAPRAAAVVGILFCVLLMTSYLLIWISVPSSLGAPALAIISHSKTVSLAMNLVPFAGIAFLWFIAVVRNRLGALEDRLFARVLLRSGLLYTAMIFTSAAYALGAMLLLSVGVILWAPLVFPAWVFLISIVILLENPSSVSPIES